MSVTFSHRAFDDLSLRELYDMLRLRDEVFVVGQKITAECEVDGLDPQCVHVLGRTPDGRMVATARIFMDRRPVKVGRVAVHASMRGQGVGAALMRHVHEVIGRRPAELSAQAYLQEWYEGLGWVTTSDVYEEAEIPHIHMEKH